MKAIDKLKEVTKFLKGCGIEATEKEAEIMVRHGFDISTVEIYRDNPELSEEQTKNLKEMLRRRFRREPLQYILGYEEFLGLKILVGPGVLIPRPETELLAEQAIKAVASCETSASSVESLRVASENKDSSLVPHPSFPSILDLCTGTGCLAIALAKEFPRSEVYGTDISEIAIGYAKRTAELNCINNVTFLKGNLFEPLGRLFAIHPSLAPCPTDGRRARSGAGCSLFIFDLIISNPPYIKTDDIRTLQTEIKDWEPMGAIDGGIDGLDFYRELIPAATRFLKDDGILMLELGSGQSSDVVDILKSSGYTQIEITKDYAGIERIIQAKWIK